MLLKFHYIDIEPDEMPNQNDPLYVGHFVSLKGLRYKTRSILQQQVYAVAVAWLRVTKDRLGCPGFFDDEMFLSNLTKESRHAKKIVECFFDIVRIGYNFHDNRGKSPTIVRAKKLDVSIEHCIKKIFNKATFIPDKMPVMSELMRISPVKIKIDNADKIRKLLAKNNRLDLLPTVNYLLNQERVDFIYAPSGKLQARETSVWPIKAIENWPRWLREVLFDGVVVDLETSYLQYLVNELDKIYSSADLKKMYPDLLSAVYDKANFRIGVCKVLKLEPTEENMTTVKKLIMALSNGSNISPQMLLSQSRSQAVSIVRSVSPDLTIAETQEVGSLLRRIARQFRRAKRIIALFASHKMTRKAQKGVFRRYFMWEREARTAIWNAVGQNGLLIHDGIDAVQTEMTNSELQKFISEKTNLRVSVECV